MKRAGALLLTAALATGCQREPAAREGAVGQDFALTSATITLPDDAETWPSDILANNCSACHSAGMILTQPRLKPEQWAATVKKMREVYKAPVADRDVPAILAALNALGASASPAGAAAAASATAGEPAAARAAAAR